MVHLLHRSIVSALFMGAVALVTAAQISNEGGTLVVAVPVQTGLVVCSDKRLYNESNKTYRDDYTKIQKAGEKALFVATHTTGFLNRVTGRMEFDIFDLTKNFVSQHGFEPTRQFWNDLRNEIQRKLFAYLSKQRFKDLPETDLANNRLLFNLVFFSVEGIAVKSYSISVYYEKAQTPVLNVSDVVTETVKNPKLLGKGKDVMGLLARSPSTASDVSILRFDQTYFKAAATTPADAVTFANRLFSLTNTRLPLARVSAEHDCALLSYRENFVWLNDSGNVLQK